MSFLKVRSAKSLPTAFKVLKLSGAAAFSASLTSSLTVYSLPSAPTTVSGIITVSNAHDLFAFVTEAEPLFK